MLKLLSVEIDFWSSVQAYYTGAGRHKMHNTTVSSGYLTPLATEAVIDTLPVVLFHISI